MLGGNAVARIKTGEPEEAGEKIAMSVHTDNQVNLSDGSSVGYAEYGDPMGKPVLHFHGFPSSRFEGHRPTMDEIATRLHARVIVVERPGIGLSDYKPYTIASWPNMKQLRLEVPLVWVGRVKELTNLCSEYEILIAVQGTCAGIKSAPYQLPAGKPVLALGLTPDEMMSAIRLVAQ